MNQYRLNPAMQYGVNSSDVVVIFPVEKRCETLGYPQAAIFDLLIRGYSIEKIESMLQSIAYLSVKHAEVLLTETIHSMVQSGILISIENS